MAEKVEEQIFTIPLRAAFGPGRLKRAAVTSRLVRKFLIKATKAEDVKIGKSINEAVWAAGIQRPPRQLRVHVLRQDKAVYAELVGVEIKPLTAEEAKKKETKLLERLKRVKSERKERRKETIQEELEAEKGKKETAKEKVAELPTAKESAAEEAVHAERPAEARKLSK